MLKQLLTSLALIGLTQHTLAQTAWTIQALGLTDPEFYGFNGELTSSADFLNSNGHVAGVSFVYNHGPTSPPGLASWIYDGQHVKRIGLWGNGYRSASDGNEGSDIYRLNEQGKVIGFSIRYIGDIAAGQASWLYDGANTVRLGFSGGAYTSSSGEELTSAWIINNQGQVLGASNRYNGTSINGLDAWIYDNGTTHQLGFIGAGYTGSDGARISSPRDINESGQVIGSSYRYTGLVENGRAAWIYSQGVTTRLGFTGGTYTGLNGKEASYAEELTESGFVTGYSNTYAANGLFNGVTAWIHKGSNTTKIGLYGPEFANHNGGSTNFIDAMNEQGQVIGAVRSQTGDAAWFYNGKDTRRIGFTDASHTQAGTLDQFSRANQLNQNGQVIGTSTRFSGSSENGLSSWLYDQGATVEIGLTGAGFERTDTGFRVNEVTLLNNRGQAAGRSDRYEGANFMGEAAWIFDGTQSREVGLSGGEYRDSNGHQSTWVDKLNEQGQATGITYRYSGIQQHGFSAWFHDIDSGQTFDLTLSESLNGFAQSEVLYLGDDGLALGRYTLFDDNGTDLGFHAFLFSMELGLWDLSEYLGSTGLDISLLGWEHLADTLSANDFRQIVGEGIRDDPTSSKRAYILTPTVAPVPVPASAWFLGAALLGLAVIGRTRSAR